MQLSASVPDLGKSRIINVLAFPSRRTLIHINIEQMYFLIPICYHAVFINPYGNISNFPFSQNMVPTAGLV